MLAPGDLVDGKYRVVRLIGVGGMGAVYEGLNLRIDRRIAIKVMHASIAEQHDAVARFEREAQAAARIGSSHVVDVFDLGDLPTGERFMVMEFLEGESLLSRFKSEGPMTAAAAADLVIELLEGLVKVHEAGIVHRDLKPANVFLVRSHEARGESVKILDFGVCKILQNDQGAEVFTDVGDILGTPSYMSPEQLEHGPHVLDARSDVYAVGVLLYRAVSGRLPFRASNLVELLVMLRAGKADPIETVADVDPAFAAIINRATEWDLAARYQSARAFQRALIEWRASSRRVDNLLSDFLELAPREDARPAPRAPAPAPAKARPKLPPPRSPARKSPKALPSPRDVRSRAPTLTDEAAPRRLRKGSSRKIAPPSPPPGPSPDDEETTIRKPDPARKKPRN